MVKALPCADDKGLHSTLRRKASSACVACRATTILLLGWFFSTLQMFSIHQAAGGFAVMPSCGNDSSICNRNLIATLSLRRQITYRHSQHY